MRHTWARDYVSGPTAVVCEECGARRSDPGADAVSTLYEECPGAPRVSMRHLWVQAPGDRGYLQSPVCQMCGESQRAVHPHGICTGPATLAEIEGLEKSRAAPGHTDLMVEPEAIDRATTLSERRVTELKGAADLADAGGLGVVIGMVILPTRELRLLLDAYDKSII